MYKKVAVILVVALLVASHVSGMLWEAGQILTSMLGKSSFFIIPLVLVVVGLISAIFFETLKGVAGGSCAQVESEAGIMMDAKKEHPDSCMRANEMFAHRNLIADIDIVAVGDEWLNATSWIAITQGNRLVGALYGGYPIIRRPLKNEKIDSVIRNA